jgi:hypothetical protein
MVPTLWKQGFVRQHCLLDTHQGGEERFEELSLMTPLVKLLHATDPIVDCQSLTQNRERPAALAKVEFQKPSLQP